MAQKPGSLELPCAPACIFGQFVQNDKTQKRKNIKLNKRNVEKESPSVLMERKESLCRNGFHL